MNSHDLDTMVYEPNDLARFAIAIGSHDFKTKFSSLSNYMQFTI